MSLLSNGEEGPYGSVRSHYENRKVGLAYHRSELENEKNDNNPSILTMVQEMAPCDDDTESLSFSHSADESGSPSNIDVNTGALARPPGKGRYRKEFITSRTTTHHEPLQIQTLVDKSKKIYKFKGRIQGLHLENCQDEQHERDRKWRKWKGKKTISNNEPIHVALQEKDAHHYARPQGQMSHLLNTVVPSCSGERQIWIPLFSILLIVLMVYTFKYYSGMTLNISVQRFFWHFEECKLSNDIHPSIAQYRDELQNLVLYRTPFKPLVIHLVALDEALLDSAVAWLSSIQHNKPISISGDGEKSIFEYHLLSLQGYAQSPPCFNEIVVIDVSKKFNPISKDWIESAIDDTRSVLYTGKGNKTISTNNWFFILKHLVSNVEQLESIRQASVSNWNQRFYQRVKRTIILKAS